MSINIEKYCKYLAPFNLGKEQEGKIIHFVYATMNEFVSAAFGKYPVQYIVDAKQRKSLQRNSNMLDSKDQNTEQWTDRVAVNRRER